MKKIIQFLKTNLSWIILLIYSIVYFAVNYRINAFRYDNFDYGKFDLGNMAQMIWNTLHGRFMYLTDYFGMNLPRWGMSHVDPILLLFIPVFLLWPSPFSLIVAQLFLVIISAFIIYKIAYLEFESKIDALVWGLIFLAYPAIGFITAWTGFHGVSVVIPFFLLAFYIFEKAHKNNNFSKGKKVIFWLLLILTMCGKEQVPLYIFLFGVFITLFRTKVESEKPLKVLSKEWCKEFIKLPNVKLSVCMMGVSLIWFYLAFSVIIPKYAPYRVIGYQNFARSLGIEDTETRDVALPNYFLSRYDAFGESYSEILVNMVLNPKKLVKVFFGGDRIENLRKTFEPLGYLPLAYPQFLILAFPDFLINYGTSAGGIGTAEINNHRISMIVPVLIISSIFSVSLISKEIKKVFNGSDLHKKYITTGISIVILLISYVATYKYNNPVYLWLTQAVKKRIDVQQVFADDEKDIAKDPDIQIGDVVKLSELEDKDRNCARRILEMIPDGASVSGPDYLGAHLSLRETYAIYPALYNSADYVIVDVFSRKLLTILDVDLDLSKEVVQRLLSSKDYTLDTGCGNLFVFKRQRDNEKSELLPLQERYKYEQKYDLNFFQNLYIADYEFPSEVRKGDHFEVKLVYTKKENNTLSDYIMFMSYINTKTGEMYQAANLPTFALKEPREWKEDRYYIEIVDSVLPQFLDTGTYKVFIGMGNKIRTRSMYLGDIVVL